MKTDSENCVCSTNFLMEIWQLENLMKKTPILMCPPSNILSQGKLPIGQVIFLYKKKIRHDFCC